jgi:hypothetical protein
MFRWYYGEGNIREHPCFLAEEGGRVKEERGREKEKREIDFLDKNTCVIQRRSDICNFK